jgi:hypothetical protein
VLVVEYPVPPWKTFQPIHTSEYSPWPTGNYFMNIWDHHCTQKCKLCTSYRNKKEKMDIRGTIKKEYFIYALCCSTVYTYCITSQSNVKSKTKSK